MANLGQVAGNMIATRDIAAEVARQLVTPTTRGHAVQLLLGSRALTMLEATRSYDGEP